MADAVETMAYAGELPWHGLGNKVSPDLTPIEMAEAAGLDWEVRSLPVKAFNPETKKFSINVDGYNMITRMSDHKTLGPCGPNWKPVQNIEALEFFNKFTQAGSMTMETAGSLDGGKHVWGLAKINKEIVLPGNDIVQGHLLLSNPHIWGKSMTIMFTPIRVVCMNTLMMAMSAKGQKFRHPHSVTWDSVQAERAEEALGLGLYLTNEFEEKAQMLADCVVDDNVIQLYVAQQMSPKAVTINKKSAEFDKGLTTRNFDTVLSLVKTQPGASLKSSANTMWGAFNAVTYFYDHEYGKTVDSRMTSAWFGANKIKKMAAWENALDFVKLVA